MKAQQQIKQLKKDIKKVIDQFIANGNYSFEAEYGLMHKVKDVAKAITAIDSTIDASKLYSSIIGYYNSLKLKEAS